MTRTELISNIKSKQSFLCVGLDTDLNKIPSHLLNEEDPVFEFNKRIIEATSEYAVAYKPNLAFYESLGLSGWKSLQKTLEIIPDDILTIADAKRGDIGNTATMYANAFFGKSEGSLNFDSITVAPYMGKDSVEPFLQFKDKWAIVLGLTSNSGSNDFQQLNFRNDERLFEKVLWVTSQWGNDENTMFVIGATRGQDIELARKILPTHFFLVPGVGAQGGSLEEVAKYALTSDCGLLVNSSRGIIYASQGSDFADKAGEAAKSIQLKMAKLLTNYNPLHE